jgi:hypothetical protein
MAWTATEPMDRDRLAGYLAGGNPNPFFPYDGWTGHTSWTQ